MIDRRLLINFDWFFFLLTLALAGVGLLNLYSASQVVGGARPGDTYLRQIYWLALSLFALGLVLRLDFRRLRRYSYPVYGLCIALLIAVLLFGRSSSGAKRWLSVMGLSFQPAEMMKLGLVLALAYYFAKTVGPVRLRGLAWPFLILLLPLLLILKQPDLGTAIILMLMFFSLLLLADVPWKTLLTVFSATLLFSPLSWFFLKGYQKARITAFLDPLADPSGAGYQSLQSKIAVGSGKILGKGFLAGTQTKLRFLPEQQTDFIFSVLAEEWGLIGAVVLLSLYILWIARALKIAAQGRSTFGTYITYGVASLLVWQVLLNISMAIGLLPVVGVPLPFMSYGGSSLLTFFIGAGLILNVGMRRFAP